jgi:hypothetical protein
LEYKLAILSDNNARSDRVSESKISDIYEVHFDQNFLREGWGLETDQPVMFFIFVNLFKLFQAAILLCLKLLMHQNSVSILCNMNLSFGQT